jgi:hypothetical protein
MEILKKEADLILLGLRGLRLNPTIEEVEKGVAQVPQEAKDLIAKFDAFVKEEEAKLASTAEVVNP